MNEVSQYLERGFGLIPISLGTKGPSTSGWNLSENVIFDPEQAHLLTANIGLAHAYCTPAPTAALDIDDVSKATDWLRERGQNLEELLAAPDAVQIVSGRPERAKLLYRLPSGAGPMPTKQIADCSSGEMILEFRCASATGLTVQDVLPPSTHPNTGKQYEWGGRGRWWSLPTMPESMFSLWRLQLKPQHSPTRQVDRSMKAYSAIEDTPRRRAVLTEMLGLISADCSYDKYRNMVWAILSLGWSDGGEIAKQWCLTAAQRFDAHSFNTITSSHDENRSPSLGTIVHFAREGGWNG